MRLPRSHPPTAGTGHVDTSAATVRVLWVTLGAGGLLVLLELALRRGHADLVGVGASLLAVALVAGVVGKRGHCLHETAFPLMLASGTLMVTAALGFAGDVAAVYPVFLLVVSVTAYRLLARMDAHVQTGLAAAAYGLAGASLGRSLAAAVAALFVGLAASHVAERRATRRAARDAAAEPIVLHVVEAPTEVAEPTKLAA
jgi:hypothetical protein